MSTDWAPSASAPQFSVLHVEQGTRQYLTHLLRDCKYLTVGNVDAEEISDEKTKLHDVWQWPRIGGLWDVLNAAQGGPLSAVLATECARLRRVLDTCGGRISVGVLGESPELSQVLDSELLRHCIVVAPPGHGKSTLMRSIAQACCNLALGGGRSLTPILVPLGSMSVADCKDIPSLLAFASEQTAGPQHVSDLLAQEEAGHLWWLLDGLDETRDPELRRAFLDLLDDFSRSSSRVWVSCRTRDFQLLARGSPGWPRVSLEPFTDDQIDRYVVDWHRMTPFHSQELRNQRLQSTNTLIRSSPVVRDMARTPLLLALICSVSASLDPEHRREGRGGKAQFLRKATETMLTVRDSVSRASIQSPQPAAASSPVLLTIVQSLAAHLLGDSADANTRQLSRGELDAFVKSDLPRQLGVDDRESRYRLEHVAESFIKRMTGGTATGLLHEVQLGIYAFIHETFREYLAAIHLLDEGPTALRDRLVARHDCYEVMRFAAAAARINTHYVPAVLRLVSAIAARSAESSELSKVASDARLAADLLAEIGRPALAASEATALSPASESDSWRFTPGSFQGLWPAVAESCWACAKDMRLPCDERVSCAVACSRIGDPRFVTSSGEYNRSRSAYVSLKGGDGLVGRQTPFEIAEPKAKRLSVGPETPIKIHPLRVRMFPVTNIEYEQFIDSGGYSNPQWWLVEAADRWRRMDATWLGTLVQHCVAGASDNLHKEMAEESLRFTKEGVIAEAMMFRGTNVYSPPRPLRPLFWDDARFNVPTAPVVGVNWWEAVAFCAWETDKLRTSGSIGAMETVGLPTEAEWEWLASRQYRGVRLAFPWGQEMERDRCALRDFSRDYPEIKFHGAPPVGCFDLAACDPDEPRDLAGGVWEWTASPKASWDKPVTDAQTNDPLFERIVRGGSWFSKEPDCAHASFRLYDPPCNAYWDLGFRTVIRQS